MLSVQVPSNNMDRSKEFIENFKTFMEPHGCKLCLHLQHYDTEKMYDIAESIRGFGQVIASPISSKPSMFDLRASLNVFNRDLKMPWLLFDDDDRFTEKSFSFYKECIEAINIVKEVTNRPAFIGTAGFFGSNHHEDKIHFSPRNALMPKGHGIVFDGEISFDFFKNRPPEITLYGGMEEAAMCAVAIVSYRAIPLKRFRCPSKMKIRKAKERETGSFIHDYGVWRENCMKYIQQVSENLDWVYPAKQGDKGSNSPKAFVDYVKKTMREFPELEKLIQKKG